MHITLRQLEVFAEVHKSGSTTQASQMLALSQSAVSAALTDLEGQLGVQLFDRVGKRLVVNEHGRLLYPRALALLERALEIEQLFRGDNGGDPSLRQQHHRQLYYAGDYCPLSS
ncbi:LysR family transcriptional regulator YeiE [Klebsiella pneumoniae subsp. pneumoniae]|uniref:LysR family transcriptional regulator YeiE n=1 Tax=Klebsiella pneumoniae subsp. pneumoniae TaxID=72407 RepID=A0A377ZBU3_KLEPN|nr:LysR family transcriptional regulator YeiE [Klebsiella pneumoniae subsp. pneumoniae]